MFAAVVNNFLMEIKLPKKHQQTSDDIQTECHRIVEAINEVLQEVEDVNHE